MKNADGFQLATDCSVRLMGTLDAVGGGGFPQGGPPGPPAPRPSLPIIASHTCCLRGLPGEPPLGLSHGKPPRAAPWTEVPKAVSTAWVGPSLPGVRRGSFQSGFLSAQCPGEGSAEEEDGGPVVTACRPGSPCIRPTRGGLRKDGSPSGSTCQHPPSPVRRLSAQRGQCWRLCPEPPLGC